MNLDTIAKNIKETRESMNMLQQELADKLNITRPVISNWENAKSEPSSTQLLKLADIFGVSTDRLLGRNLDSKNIIVVDTSALIKKPFLPKELVEKFDEVIVPDVVISELNNIKDKKDKNSQAAWLIMSTIKNLGEKIINSKSDKSIKNSDEKIADVAKTKAKQNPNDKVYMLSDDIYFQFLIRDINNIKVITPNEYFRDFGKDDKFDRSKSLEFLSLVKNNKFTKLEHFNLDNINVNIHDPISGLTPLITAIRNKNPQIIEYLLNLSSIDINALDEHKYSFSALHHAAQLKNIELMKLLVSRGADVELGSKGENFGNTPLMVCAWSGFENGVDFLLQQGACVNQQDNNGFTALMKACIKEHKNIIFTLSRITDIRIRDKKNKTAFEYLRLALFSQSEARELKKLLKGERDDR
jgi:putative ankyrin repeat protein|nr:ankyrin repeat domain-containing protein [uncultured Campylobacter sp.]